jgi:hypothetical protein
MSLLRCEVIKIVVYARVKCIILVLHYALTEVSAINHSIHIVYYYHHTMQTFRVTTLKINKHKGLNHHNYFLQMPNQCKKFVTYTT